MSTIYAALEIGTTRTVLAVGESESGENLKVIACEVIPSSGVRKSQIIDINQATQSIRSALHGIAKASTDAGSLTIGNAFLVVTGQNITAARYQGTAQIGSTSKVGNDELNEVMRSAHAMALPKGRELIDIFDQDYEVDMLPGISSPKGMSGRVLRLNTLQIHADKNRLDDARTAAEAAHLEIRDPLFSATCAAEATLDDTERRDGVLLINFGGGSTEYCAYTDMHLASTGVIGVGGDHVTNDIANAFQTTQAQAEALKIDESSAILSSGVDVSPRVSVSGSSPLMEARTVSRRALNTIVNARVRETLSIIREKLEDEGLLHQIHSGVVITGGGAEQRDLEQVIQHEFGLSVRIGRPINVTGLEDRQSPASYAAIAGALLYARRNYDEKTFISTLLGGIFRK